MDIIEFAMKMEQDGKAYYENLAAGTTDSELKKVLEQLAEEEGRHYEYFRRLKSDPDDLSGGKALMGSETLARVKNIFEDLARHTSVQPFGQDVIEAWTKALRTEEQSEAFYREKAGQEPDEAKKALLLKIAGEEKNHIHMIDGILMYLRDPQTFSESAQYKNFRSLEGWG